MNRRILATLLLLLATACDAAPTRRPSAPPRVPAPEATRPAPAPPQDTTIEVLVHPALPPYRFIVFSTNGATADSVLVFRGTEPRPVQVMRFAAGSFDGDPEFVDLNFDGYRDVQLADAMWVGFVADHRVFEPSTGTFRYMGEFHYLTPDPRTRELTVFIPSGCCGGVSRTYAWEGDTLAVIRRKEWGPSASGDSIISYTEEMRDGEWRFLNREAALAEEQGP